jgi:hypothetical protein
MEANDPKRRRVAQSASKDQSPTPEIQAASLITSSFSAGVVKQGFIVSMKLFRLRGNGVSGCANCRTYAAFMSNETCATEPILAATISNPVL